MKKGRLARKCECRLTDHDGRGVDIILESIGGDIFEQNFECLATFGRYIIFGSTRGPGAPFAPRRLMTKCQTMTGIYVPVFFAQRPDLVHEAFAFLVAHTLDGTDSSQRLDSAGA